MALRATDLNESSNGWVFLKMHGLGNDFVIIDAREDDIDIRAKARRVLWGIVILAWALINWW